MDKLLLIKEINLSLENVIEKQTNIEVELIKIGENATALKKIVKTEGKTEWALFCKKTFQKRSNRVDEAIAVYRLFKENPKINFSEISTSNKIQISQSLKSKNKNTKNKAMALIKEFSSDPTKSKLFQMSHRQLKSHLNNQSTKTSGSKIKRDNTKDFFKTIDGWEKYINDIIKTKPKSLNTAKCSRAITSLRNLINTLNDFIQYRGV